MEKLFDDTFLVENKRPEVLTKQQKKEMYLNLADEAIKYKYSEDDRKVIAKDFGKIYNSHSGFEKAKHLEKYGHANYEFDGDFIDWLDSIDHIGREIIRASVRLWVTAHNIKPNLNVGQELTIIKTLNHKLIEGDIIYVSGMRENEALYTVSKDKNTESGYLIPFEQLEVDCKIN